MLDLIFREAAMDILHECGGDEIYPPNMVKMRGKMYKLPAVDAVEVVRCKDCKFFKFGDYCTEDKMEHGHARETDFCSYGKRREENG